MYTKSVLGIVVVLILVGGAIVSSQSQEGAASSLGLKHPWIVKSVMYYSDGGSIQVSVADKQGGACKFWYDGGLRARCADEPTYSPHRTFYLGGRNDPDATRVSVCSDQDQAILYVLGSWAAEQFPSDDIEKRHAELAELDNDSVADYRKNLRHSEDLALQVWRLLETVRANRESLVCN